MGYSKEMRTVVATAAYALLNVKYGPEELRTISKRKKRVKDVDLF